MPCAEVFEAAQQDSPRKAALYNSGVEYRTHLTKHLRRPATPSTEYAAPVTESQKIGWDVARYQSEQWDVPGATGKLRLEATAGARRVPNQQYHHKATELSHYNDCVSKHEYGRSVAAEFGAYGRQRLMTHSLQRHASSGAAAGLQQPEFGRYAACASPEPRKVILGMTNVPMSGTFKARGEGGSYFKARTSRYGEHFLKTCG